MELKLKSHTHLFPFLWNATWLTVEVGTAFQTLCHQRFEETEIWNFRAEAKDWAGRETMLPSSLQRAWDTASRTLPFFGVKPLHSPIASSGSTKTNPWTVWNGIVPYTRSSCKKHQPIIPISSTNWSAAHGESVYAKTCITIFMATQVSQSGFPNQDTCSGTRKTGIAIPGSPRAPAQHCWISTTQHISHPGWTLARRQGWEHTPEPAGAPQWQYWIKQPTEVLQQLQTPKETLLPDVTFSSPLFHSPKKASLKTC